MSLREEYIKEELHKLIDSLPQEEAIAAKHYLKFLLSESKRKKEEFYKVLQDAPIDDEPLSEEDRSDIEETREEIQNNETISLDAVKRKLGL